MAKLNHTHSNHLPKKVKRKIENLQEKGIFERIRIGLTYNHKHNSTPGKMQFQRKMPNTGWIKIKVFTNDGTVDLFVSGNKELILGAI